jgi:hypothetical protein
MLDSYGAMVRPSDETAMKGAPATPSDAKER